MFCFRVASLGFGCLYERDRAGRLPLIKTQVGLWSFADGGMVRYGSEGSWKGGEAGDNESDEQMILAWGFDFLSWITDAIHDGEYFRRHWILSCVLVFVGVLWNYELTNCCNIIPGVRARVRKYNSCGERINAGWWWTKADLIVKNFQELEKGNSYFKVKGINYLEWRLFLNSRELCYLWFAANSNRSILSYFDLGNHIEKTLVSVPGQGRDAKQIELNPFQLIFVFQKGPRQRVANKPNAQNKVLQRQSKENSFSKTPVPSSGRFCLCSLNTEEVYASTVK